MGKANKILIFLIALFLVSILFSVFCMFITYGVKADIIEDNQTVSVYQAKTGLINPPTVVTMINDSDDLEKLIESTKNSSNVRPSNAIFYLNNKAQIVNKMENEVLGEFSSIFNSLNHKVIPIIYIRSEGQANSLINFLKEEIDILDIAVMSNDETLIKKIRTQINSIRAILEVEETDDLYKDIVAVANSSFANVVAIPQSMATIDNVRYIQMRLKTVWTFVDDSDSFNYYQCINSGAYGLIVNDYVKAYEVLETYIEGSFSRTPYIIGHRGTPTTKNQNSISGFKNAFDCNVTHVEYDAYLTTDNKIVMMHNTTLDETSNVETINNGVDAGKHIESMSLARIRQYKLDKKGEEEIPILDDVLNELIKTDVILVLEIKSSKPNIIPFIKQLLDKYDCYDQVVVISFNTEMLMLMKDEIPTVPTAYLGTVKKSTLGFLNLYNTNIDTNCTKDVTEELNAFFRDRGYMGWYWTFSSYVETKQASMKGFIGLVTDVADVYVKDNQERIVGIENNNFEKEIKKYDRIPLKLIMQDGTEKQVDGKVFDVKKTDSGYKVVAMYFCSSSSMLDKQEVLYTEVFEVKSIENIENVVEETGGCSSFVNNVNFTAFILIVLVVVSFFIKKSNYTK